MPHPVTARLYVLGCLRKGPLHGYAVRQAAKMERTETWAGLRSGSIYHALSSLETDGFVTVQAVDRDGNRPARTTYAISPSGRAELRRLIEVSIANIETPADPVDVALRLTDELDPGETIELLRKRANSLREQVGDLLATFHDVVQFLSAPERVAFEHTLARLRFEADWFADTSRWPQLP